MKQDDPNGCDCCAISGFVIPTGASGGGFGGTGYGAAYFGNSEPQWYTALASPFNFHNPFRPSAFGGTMAPGHILGYDWTHNALVMSFDVFRQSTQVEFAFDAAIVRMNLDYIGSSSKGWKVLATRTQFNAMLADRMLTFHFPFPELVPDPVSPGFFVFGTSYTQAYAPQLLNYDHLSKTYNGVVASVIWSASADPPGTAAILVPPLSSGNDYGDGIAGLDGDEGSSRAGLNPDGSQPIPTAGDRGCGVWFHGSYHVSSIDPDGGATFLTDGHKLQLFRTNPGGIDVSAVGVFANDGFHSTHLIEYVTGSFGYSVYDGAVEALDLLHVSHPDFFINMIDTDNPFPDYEYLITHSPWANPSFFDSNYNINVADVHTLAYDAIGTQTWAWLNSSSLTETHYDGPCVFPYFEAGRSDIHGAIYAPNLGGYLFFSNANAANPGPITGGGFSSVKPTHAFFTNGGAATKILFDDPFQQGTITLSDPDQAGTWSGYMEISVTNNDTDEILLDTILFFSTNRDLTSISNLAVHLVDSVTESVSIELPEYVPPDHTNSISEPFGFFMPPVPTMELHLDFSHTTPTVARLIELLDGYLGKCRLATGVDDSAVISGPSSHRTMAGLLEINTSDPGVVINLVKYRLPDEPISHSDLGAISLVIHNSGTQAVDYDKDTKVLTVHMALDDVFGNDVQTLCSLIGGLSQFNSIQASPRDVGAWTISTATTGAGALAFGGVREDDKSPVNFIYNNATGDVYLLYASAYPGGNLVYSGGLSSPTLGPYKVLRLNETPSGDYFYVPVWQEVPYGHYFGIGQYFSLTGFGFSAGGLPYIGIPAQS